MVFSYWDKEDVSVEKAHQPAANREEALIYVGIIIGMTVLAVLLMLFVPQKARGAVLPQKSGSVLQACQLRHSQTRVRLCVRAVRLRTFLVRVTSTGSLMSIRFSYACDNTDALTSGPAFGEGLTARTFRYSFSMPRPAIGRYLCTIVLEARLLKRGGRYALHARWTRYGIQAKTGLSA